jgi:hypothetical protein
MSSAYQYPRLNQSQVDRNYQALTTGVVNTLPIGIEYLSCSGLVNLDPLKTVIVDMLEAGIPKNVESWEDDFSQRFYNALDTLPDAVIADFGFWRYITLVEMKDVLKLRDPKFGNIICGVGDRNKRPMALGLRMYLRGRMYNVDKTLVGKLINNISETESSHLFTGRTARQVLYGVALREHISNIRPSQDEGRQLVRRLNEAKATVLIEYLDLPSCQQFIKKV